jgi:hypothetical protein
VPWEVTRWGEGSPVVPVAVVKILPFELVAVVVTDAKAVAMSLAAMSANCVSNVRALVMVVPDAANGPVVVAAVREVVDQSLAAGVAPAVLKVLKFSVTVAVVKVIACAEVPNDSVARVRRVGKFFFITGSNGG